MVLEIWVVSEGNNSHNMPISRDAIINSAPSIIGKPVLYRYSTETDDFMAHEIDEIACGVLPLSNADYYFKEDKEGKLWLVCKAYIWKMYYPEVEDVFKRDEQKAISMEILVVDSEVGENNETQINTFSFTGITLLGNTYKPAIANAKATVEKFSEMVKETERLVCSHKLNHEEKEVKEVADLKFNKADFAKTYNYTVNEMMEEFEKQCSQTYVEKCGGESYECKKYRCKDFCGQYVYVVDYEKGCYGAVPYGKDLKMSFVDMKKCRLTYVVDTEMQEMPEGEMPEGGMPEGEMPEGECGEKEVTINLIFSKKDIEEKLIQFKENSDKSIKTLKQEKERIETESEKFSVKLAELQKEIALLKTNNEELANFKSNVLKQEREQNIKFAIDSVSDVLSKDQIKEWSTKAESYENVDSFKNAIQAFAFTQTKNIPSNDISKTVIHIPKNDIEGKKGLWD